jgi:Holliday junction resolvase-like predicted endonuclease
MPEPRQNMKKSWKDSETQARRAIEDQGFEVQDANILFRANCPNIDLVVFGEKKAIYVQVKSSETPAVKDGVVISGSPWTEAQLYHGAPIFNRHADQYEAALILIVDKAKDGSTNFYIAPSKDLEDLVRPWAVAWANRPKRDGSRRSINFRKEATREALAPWLNAWHLITESTS